MLNENYAVIVVNGSIEDEVFHKKIIDKSDIILACDGGANILYDLGYMADFLVGDMDSVEQSILSKYKENRKDIIYLPVEKDITDSEKGLSILKEKGYKNVVMLGALGDRVDHFLANLDLFYFADKNNLNLKIITRKSTIFLIKTGKTVIDSKIGSTVSFNTISGNCYGISLTGFKYRLDNDDMLQGSFHMTSNIVTENNPVIEIKKGSLLCVITNN